MSDPNANIDRALGALLRGEKPQRKSIALGICIRCEKPAQHRTLADAREYAISGICGPCYDVMLPPED